MTVLAVAALAAAAILAGPASAQTTTSSIGVCAVVCQTVESDTTVISQLADTADGACAIVGEQPPPEQYPPPGQPELCVRDPDGSLGPSQTDFLHFTYGTPVDVSTYESRDRGPCGESDARGFDVGRTVTVYDERHRTYC